MLVKTYKTTTVVNLKTYSVFSELSGAENWFLEEIKNTETNGILKTLYLTEDFGDQYYSGREITFN